MNLISIFLNFSRFVFPDGTAYVPKDKTINFDQLSLPSKSHLPESVTSKSRISVDTKPLKSFGNRDDHQKLANDIIKYNSTIMANSPAKNNQLVSQSPSSMNIIHPQRPKSSNYIDDEINLSDSHSRPHLELRSYEDSDVSDIENLSQHHLKSSRELKKNALSTSKSHSHSVSGGFSQHIDETPKVQNILSQPLDEIKKQSVNTTDKNQQSSKEVGIDFDVDRAFRRNRLAFIFSIISIISIYLLLTYLFIRRKWELLEGLTGQSNENFSIEGGGEELDLLLGGLNSVSSSRPTTSGETR